jgi:hypothetical protein
VIADKLASLLMLISLSSHRFNIRFATALDMVIFITSIAILINNKL